MVLNALDPEGKTMIPVPTSATLASSIALRIRQLAPRLHRLGPRPLYEFCCELAGGADPLARLERYAQLDPDTVHALGADVLPPVVRRVK
jgi:hypothetical protein